MSEWVADNKEEYISKAIKFSSNLDELSKIRITLKEKALQSPVFNAPRFANNFSDLLWKMWDEFIRKS
jgi:predicted O-linked N-acetylglucosamine transferase (SPINDLY family)